jgi:hypothetical protein
MKADIHIFAVVRVKVTAVEGADDHAGIENAVRQAGLEALFLPVERTGGIEVEYADEITEYLVDPYDATGRPDLEYVRRYRDAAHVEVDAADDAPVHSSHMLAAARDASDDPPTRACGVEEPPLPNNLAGGFSHGC